jgi:nucleoid-associated protein YgaU
MVLYNKLDPMPKKANSVNYQQLLFSTIREKYFNLILGMVISLVITSLAYQFFLKNIPVDVAFKWPEFRMPGVDKKTNPVTAKKIPEKTYVIQEGDDLWKIAEKFYGSGFNAYDISAANNIIDPSTLTAGNKLIIPDVKRREPTVGEVSSTSTTKATYTEGKYVVQPGDSLSIISQKVYGDLFSWPSILEANNLQNADQIEVGMVLVIPQ